MTIDDRWEIYCDDSGESEYYNEGAWFIANPLGHVLDDLSFDTQEEAINYLVKHREESK